MRKYLALTAGVAALTCTMFSTSASALEGAYLGPSLGYYIPDDKRTANSDHNEALNAGLNFGYRFDNDWALELGYGQNLTGSDLEKMDLSAYFYLGDSEEYERKLRTYWVTGLSRYQTEELNTLSDFDDSWQAQLGFGLSKLYDSNWEVRGDLRVYHKIRDGQDGTNDVGLNFAFLKHFGDAPAAAPVAKPEPVKPEPIVAPEPAPEPEPEMRTITVRLDVEFEFNSDVVRAIYGDQLEAIANAMKVHEDIDLVLEGHTDSRGSDEYNQSLSERRAKAVKAALSKTYSIDASRISAVGYGESRPVASNDTDEGRQRNRRVVGEMSYTEVAPE